MQNYLHLFTIHSTEFNLLWRSLVDSIFKFLNGLINHLFFFFFFQRPRKVGAKYTGMNIAPDEHVQPQLMFDYDGKRDRWNGYNPEEHMKIVEEYSKVDLVRGAVIYWGES